MISEIISSIDYNEYDFLTNKTNFCTFFHSKNHIHFLESILEIKSKFITVREKNELVGVLPYFEKKEKYGIVINSLPFFGSYGGIISNKLEIQKMIIKELNSINKENDILSSVIIDNPFNVKNKIYDKELIFHTSDKRKVQCTILKNRTNDDLWTSFEKRVRWSVKKSQKNNIKILIKNTDEFHTKNFYQLHVNSMKTKGAKPKPQNLFSTIFKNFKSGTDYDIYVAFKENQPIAYLLIFYYNNFAEYYLPTYDPKFLSLQSTSHLIWYSMKKSMEKGIEFYNFGGTWKNQKDLYRFKRGWNARDFEYNYFIFRDIERIKEIGIENILKKYEYFYICPFDELEN